MPHIGVTVYDLLLSCPGDVLDLKDTVDACVKSFNSSIGEANNIRVELKHWSTDSFSQSGDKPQNILNRQFVDDCDLCVALLGTRFGTPTDNYDSGTEEEIEKMLKQDKQVFLYFVERSVDPSKIDLEQYVKVKEFRNKYNDKGVYTIVKSAEELRSDFQNALSLYFIKLVAPNTTQLQPIFAPKLVISSTDDEGTNITPIHTCYQTIELVKDKEDKIKKLIDEISAITITQSPEKIFEESKPMNSDEELQNKTAVSILESSNNIFGLVETKLPVYRKVEVDEKQRGLISAFCEKHDIILNSDFYYLGDLKKETRLVVVPAFGNNDTSYIGSDLEQKKYKLFDDLLYKIEEYNDMMVFFEAVDSMPCVSLKIENQGNTYDEDIDVKLFVEHGCFVDIDSIPEPGLLFLEEAVKSEIPRVIFCGSNDAEIEDFSNYPDVISHSSVKLLYPFKSIDEEIEEEQEEYRDMLESVFCYDLRRNEEGDMLCFNIPYLKQNKKMFLPSYLFFSKIPQNLRYEICSKHSPEVYKGTLTFE